MAPHLVLSSALVERLRLVTKPGSGFIYGLVNNNQCIALGFFIWEIERFKEMQQPVSLFTKEEVTICAAWMKSCLPSGVGIVGSMVICGEDSDEPEPGSLFNGMRVAVAANVCKDIFITSNPYILYHEPSSGIEALTAQLYNNHELEDATFVISPLSELLQPYMIIRLKAQLHLVAESNEDAIKEEFNTLRKKMKSGVSTFHFKQSAVYLSNNDTKNGVSGIGRNNSVEQLLTVSNSEDGAKKKKKSAPSSNLEVLNAELLLKASKFLNPGEPHPSSDSAPVIQHIKRDYDCVSIPLTMDGLSLVSRTSPVSAIYKILTESVDRHLQAAEMCVISTLKNFKKVCAPVPTHFMPEPCGHLMTIFYPKGVLDEKLGNEREVWHERLSLSKDRPLFKRGCKHVFKDEFPPNSPLTNPHVGLPHPLKDSEVAIVSGRYSYHHYMQDQMDDSGWGCAYRSLQTLISWFRWQGYTEKPVPTHRAIQQCLVDIGDKPGSFVGSRQWIGSTEVSFVLESMLGLTSRIMAVNSREEMAERAEELLRHFQSQGTPIMIGGGVLAHTILGIAFNRETAELRFLVLDPHYTGIEDLKTIQNGWCSWKNMDFWAKSAFYNLAMPQRPIMV